MLEALRDAILFTLLVILLFLGNLRAVAAALASIPMVFFATIAIIWLAGGELNIVIYTAIILALGMLVDDAVVVLENIERHLTEMKEDLKTAIIHGTKEVIAPVFAGTVATIAIMFPFLFVGDFPQQIFRPLISTLIIALLVSYFLSITFIPAIWFFLYRKGISKTRFEQLLERLYEKSFGRLVGPYLAILRFSAGGRSGWRRMLMTVGVVVLLALSVKTIMPVIGRDLMPPMDTGIIKAHVKFSANETVDTAEKRLTPFLVWLHQQPEVVMSSVSFGSEPGVLSLGSGSLPAEAMMTINCVDRFERKKTSGRSRMRSADNWPPFVMSRRPMSMISGPRRCPASRRRWMCGCWPRTIISCRRPRKRRPPPWQGQGVYLGQHQLGQRFYRGPAGDRHQPRPGLWHDPGADRRPASPGRCSGRPERQPGLHADPVRAALFQPPL